MNKLHLILIANLVELKNPYSSQDSCYYISNKFSWSSFLWNVIVALWRSGGFKKSPHSTFKVCFSSSNAFLWHYPIRTNSQSNRERYRNNRYPATFQCPILLPMHSTSEFWAFYSKILVQVLSTLFIIILSTPIFGIVVIPLAIMYFMVLVSGSKTKFFLRNWFKTGLRKNWFIFSATTWLLPDSWKDWSR